MADLKKTIEALAKKAGKKVIYSGDETPMCRKIPTGIPAFDYVSSGGFLVNQNNELFGSMSSLKSYMCYIAMGKFQKYDWGNDVPNAITNITYKVEKSRASKDEEAITFYEIDKVSVRRGYKPKNEVVAKRVALIDMESTYNREWGAKLGVDNKGLLYYSDCSMNQAIDIIEVLLRDDSVCLVVLDSMSIIGSDLENEKSMEDEQMAANARLWNKAARKLRSALNANRDGTLISINATSTKMGGFGDPETVKNGEQWKLFKSLSVRLNALVQIKGKIEGKGEVTLGRNISLINKKNKFGEPFRTAEMYYSLVEDGYLGAGQIDVVASLVEFGVRFGVVTRSGSMYSVGEHKVNGIDNFRKRVAEDKVLFGFLEEEVYKHF